MTDERINVSTAPEPAAEAVAVAATAPAPPSPPSTFGPFSITLSSNDGTHTVLMRHVPLARNRDDAVLESRGQPFSLLSTGSSQRDDEKERMDSASLGTTAAYFNPASPNGLAKTMPVADVKMSVAPDENHSMIDVKEADSNARDRAAMPPPQIRPVARLQKTRIGEISRVRLKEPLAPGHSALHWAQHHSGIKRRQFGKYSAKEIAEHKLETDCWIILRGKVYDVTAYLDYHPGGKRILMKAAGRDATKLFDSFHPWVNPDFLLQNCLIGVHL